MANKYSKANFVNKEEDKSPKETESAVKMSAFEKKRKRINTAAKVMALLVAVAMIVTAFLSSGVFFLD